MQNEDVLKLGFDISDVTSKAKQFSKILKQMSTDLIGYSVTNKTVFGPQGQHDLTVYVEAVTKAGKTISEVFHRGKASDPFSLVSSSVSAKESLITLEELVKKYSNTKLKAVELDVHGNEVVLKSQKALEDEYEKAYTNHLTKSSKLHLQEIENKNKEIHIIDKQIERENILLAKRLLRQHIAKSETSKSDMGSSNVTGSSVVSGFETFLGGSKSSFTARDVSNIESVKNSLISLFTKTKIGTERFNELFNAIRHGTLSSLGILTEEERRATLGMRRLIAAFNDANNVGQKSESVFISWRGLARIFVVQQLHQIIGRVTNSLLSATSAALEYSKRIGEVQTISQRAARTSEEWSTSLANLSNEYNIEILKTTEAAYEALSNQIAKGTAVNNFLGESFIFSRTTASTAAEGVNLLSSAINAYDLSATATNRISGILFKTIDLGRVRASQMANTFGNTASLAKTLGIELEELAASITTLTRQGIKYDTSATLINNIILKLLKPTEEMKNLFTEWGVTSGEAAIQTYGFVGVIQKLEQEFQKGGLSRLGEVETDMRAIRGAAGLAGSAFQSFQKDFQEIKNTQDEYEKAAAITANTLEFKLNKQINELNTLMVSDAGKRALEINLRFAESIGGLANNLKPVFTGFLNVYDITTRFGSIVINTASGVAYLVGGFGNLIPILATTYVSVKTVSFATDLLNNRNKLWADALNNLIVNHSTHNVKLVELGVKLGLVKVGIDGVVTSMWSMTAAQAAVTFGIPLAVAGLTYLVTSYANRSRDIAELSAKVQADLEEINRKILSQLAKRIDAENVLFEKNLDGRSKNFFNYITLLRRGVQQQKEVFDSLTFKFEEQDFNNSILGKTPLQSLDQLKARIEELNDKAFKFKNDGNLEIAKKHFEDINNLVSDVNSNFLRAIKDIDKEIIKLSENKENKLFENSLLGLSDPAKASKISQQIAKIRDEAQGLIDAGDIETGSKKLEDAFRLSENLISTSKGRQGKTIQQEIIESQIDAAKKYKEQLETNKIDEQQIARQNLSLIEQQIQDTQTLSDNWTNIKQTLQDINKEHQKANDLINNGQQKIRESISKIIGNSTQIRAFTTDYKIPFFDTENPAAREMVKGFEFFKKEFENLLKSENIDNNKLSELKKNYNKFINDYEDSTLLLNSVVGKNGETLQTLLNQTTVELNGLSSILSNISVAQARTIELKNIQIDFTAQEAKLKAEADRAGLVLTDLNDTTVQFTDKIKQIPSLADAMVEAITRLSAGITNDKANGGLLGFAGGGLIKGPVGRDRRTFNASSGEMVMDEEAVKRFYPTLSAMNANNNYGHGPITNVGDINIQTTLTGNTDVDVAAIAKKIQRGIRSGTMRLT